MPGGWLDANAVNWGSDELGALAADAMNNMSGNMIGAGVGVWRLVCLIWVIWTGFEQI